MSQHGTFIWADLSTFRPSITTAFYGSLFGWSFADAGAHGGKDDSMDGGVAGYTVATTKADPVAALYPMPQTFVDMGMPSFWMSYIAVDDVAACAALARDLGARVELGPAPFGSPNASAKDGGEDGGTYALIRDPLGAGFTVYQGPDFAPDTTDQNGPPNTRQGHALFVSDAQAVIPFYQALFGWDFAPLTSDSWAITSAQDPTADGALAHLYEIPDPRVRGREEYWAVLFNGPADAAQVASSLGGSHVADIDLHEGSVQVIADPDGGTFMVLPNGTARAATVGDTPRNATATPPATPPTKWKAWTGLALIALSVMTGWSWISALFFALWAVMGIRDRATFLLEPVERADTPLLYWLIIGSFAGLSPLILLYG